VGFLLWGALVSLGAELSSTRVGFPFGLYHYTGETAGAEMYFSNVPFFSTLSFPFLAYASFCLARAALGRSGPPAAPAGSAWWPWPAC
jgi:putative membrane protein